MDDVEVVMGHHRWDIIRYCTHYFSLNQHIYLSLHEKKSQFFYTSTKATNFQESKWSALSPSVCCGKKWKWPSSLFVLMLARQPRSWTDPLTSRSKSDHIFHGWQDFGGARALPSKYKIQQFCRNAIHDIE